MDLFSTDYQTARKTFRIAADGAAAWTSRLDISSLGPQREPLTIDIAWLGERSATQVLLHTSGLHGIEGFAGSAIQTQLLADPPKIAPDCALLLIHILNPYGMAWLRRVNAENVDLNRNFIFQGHLRQGTTETYELLDPVLNPPYPPRADGFYLRALYFILRYGYRQLKTSIACGQYAFPAGIFYGGNCLQQEVLAYHDWLQKNLQQPKRLLVVDVHTGLGKTGQEQLIHELLATPTEELERCLGKRLTVAGRQHKPLGYEVLGGHHELFRELFPSCATDFITQEFGTRPGLDVLRALRAENQWHRYGSGSLDHQTKQSLKKVFCPSSVRWQQQVVQRGVQLVHCGLDMLADRSVNDNRASIAAGRGRQPQRALVPP